MTKILEAELQGFNDPMGFRYANGPQLCVTVDVNPPVGKFRYYPDHKGFIAEEDGWITAHWHSDSETNEGGYCGRWFEVEMEDGTKRSLKGPWHGGSRDITRATGKEVVEVHVREKGWTTYCFGYFVTVEKAQEILKFVRPFKEEGGQQFRVVLVRGVDTIPNFTFAIIKTPWQVKDANIILNAEVTLK